jgi:hypothetical protein
MPFGGEGNDYMFVVHSIEKVDRGVTCDAEIDGVRRRLEVVITQHRPNLRSLDFVNLSDKDFLTFSNREDWCQFEKLVWQFFDGENLSIPIEVSAE